MVHSFENHRDLQDSQDSTASSLISNLFRLASIPSTILQIFGDHMNHPHQDITREIIGACFEVMNELGTGFLESVYRKSLAIALRHRGLSVQQEAPLKVHFRGEEVGHYVADIVVNEVVIVETKVAEAIASEYLAQVINYLKASDKQVGIVANFGKPIVQHRTLVHPILHAQKERIENQESSGPEDVKS
jgi:GxxExxY protein